MAEVLDKALRLKEKEKKAPLVERHRFVEGVENSSNIDANNTDGHDEILRLRSELHERSEQYRKLERRLQIIALERDGLKQVLAKYYEDDAVGTQELKSLQDALNEANSFIKELQCNQTHGPQAASDNAHGTMESLRSENQALKKKLETMQADIDNMQKERAAALSKAAEVSSANKTTSNANCQPEIEDLKRSLANAQMTSQRLKEVFRKKIQEFREVVYTLFGYRVDMDDNVFKLRSMFAERESDLVMLQAVSSVTEAPGTGALQLLETDFINRLPDDMLDYLHRAHSIPAFLSNLTLQLFNSQTITT